MLLWTSRAGAISGVLCPSFAPWIANIVLGLAGVGLVVWRAGAADQPIRISVPPFWQRAAGCGRRPRVGRDERRGTREQGRGRHPGAARRLPRPTLLDLYVSRQYLRIFGVSFVSLVGLFYISTFIDLADKLFRGTATSGMLLRYFYWQTPQYVYYIIPLAALVATLVTIGLLTKNSELIVMRACGISLYRSAAAAAAVCSRLAAACSSSCRNTSCHARTARHSSSTRRSAAGRVQNVRDPRSAMGRRQQRRHLPLRVSSTRRVNQFTSLSIFQVDQARVAAGVADLRAGVSAWSGAPARTSSRR